MSELPPFDPNGYRKQVLAAVERRGGPDTSDPFELYDLPVDAAAAGELDDAAVAERIDAVWGFWQRQRDHPKYRVLVALLVETHAERSAELRDAGRRRLAAVRVRAQRAQRDAARYELLDAAVSRLVQRHGGLPRDKIAGLHEVGALAGLDAAEVTARLNRHRLLDTATPAGPVEPVVGPERRRQLRALLDEFGRLTDAPAPPTLLALLGLDAAASDEQIRARAGSWRARARELPPERLRAVLDELLVHVADLLEPGRAAVADYLDAVAADVADALRPRLRAAVLVEDRLVAEDHAHLLDEAVRLGLDRTRARTVIAALAAELQAPIEGDTDPGPTGPAATADEPAPARGPAPARPWEEALRAARAALRGGRTAQAQQLAADAQRLAGADGATPVRAVVDEIDGVLAQARLHWRAAAGATAARRWAEAVEHLEHLERSAADVAGPAGETVADLLGRAREQLRRADAAVAAALAGPESDRVRALQAVLAHCPDHPAALAALARIPVAAPAWVSAARDARGAVLVLWEPSPTPEVVYKVSRRRPDGGWQIVGRVSATSLEDGGAPDGVEAPVYAVAALAAGRASEPTRSDAAPAGRPASPVVGGSAPPPAGGGSPRPVAAVRLADGSVEISWVPTAAGAEYRVRRRRPDGGWRVLGRTRATSMHDGTAPPGPLPVYAVGTITDGVLTGEVRTDG